MNSCHAECDAINNTFGRYNTKFTKKRTRFTMYSLAFRYSTVENMIYIKDAKPCKSCTNIIKNMGIVSIIWSNTDCTISKSNITDLMATTTHSFGDRLVNYNNNRKIISSALYFKLFVLTVNNDSTFNNIYKSMKTIEGRLWRGAIRTLKLNQIIIIRYNNKDIYVQITFIRRYNNFTTLLNDKKNNLVSILPDATSIIDGVRKYNTMYSKKDLKTYDATAVGIKILHTKTGIK